jgi:hypothetical protein
MRYASKTLFEDSFVQDVASNPFRSLVEVGGPAVLVALSVGVHLRQERIEYRNFMAAG